DAVEIARFRREREVIAGSQRRHIGTERQPFGSSAQRRAELDQGRGKRLEILRVARMADVEIVGHGRRAQEAACDASNDHESNTMSKKHAQRALGVERARSQRFSRARSFCRLRASAAARRNLSPGATRSNSRMAVRSTPMPRAGIA